MCTGTIWNGFARYAYEKLFGVSRQTGPGRKTALEGAAAEDFLPVAGLPVSIKEAGITDCDFETMLDHDSFAMGTRPLEHHCAGPRRCEYINDVSRLNEPAREAFPGRLYLRKYFLILPVSICQWLCYEVKLTVKGSNMKERNP